MLNVEDTTNRFIVKKVLEGLKRLKHHVDTRLPITSSLLVEVVQIFPGISSDLYEGRMFSSAFTLDFACFLRVGEFTYSTSCIEEKIISVNDALLDESQCF